MMVVVFRARRTAAGLGEEYFDQSQRMTDLAVKMPGYVSHKAFFAEDGERLTLIEWESPDTLRAWVTHPEHVLVKEIGRRKFYEDYRLQVCEVCANRPSGASPSRTHRQTVEKGAERRRSLATQDRWGRAAPPIDGR
jgi:heme-degrading monooxygenase HmoA